MAEAQGVSKNTIQRIWEENQLKPHLSKTFKLSPDPQFVEKLTDVVGVYLTPQNAVVLCVDEKSQIQALDRTEPGLPLKAGRCGNLLTTTSTTEPPLFLRRCRCWKDASLASVTRAIDTKNFFASCGNWMRSSPATKAFI